MTVTADVRNITPEDVPYMGEAELRAALLDAIARLLSIQGRITEQRQRAEKAERERGALAAQVADFQTWKGAIPFVELLQIVQKSTATIGENRAAIFWILDNCLPAKEATR
jgi:hypothetical protein